MHREHPHLSSTERELRVDKADRGIHVWFPYIKPLNEDAVRKHI